jgi:DNA modification methylase
MKHRLFVSDSRRISKLLSDTDRIQTTITSPPYFDMKDYGVEGQIGFGQSYQEYLDDLTKIFDQIRKHTCEDGTLWIIIDTFKRNGNIVLLPFDIAERLKGVGWHLQNIIIWKKDKTVPWASSGFVQRKFEYILFFSKNNEYKSYGDRVRIFDQSKLKEWWIRYPERYNPKGKALDEVWDFPIPVQGSWGKEYIKHFCPLPKEMVSTMISLSTDEGDLVCDPFAGTGTVLAQAAFMKRGYMGVELNPLYAKQCRAYIRDTREAGRLEYQNNKYNSDQESFERRIISLRALKYGRLILRKLEEEFSVPGSIRVYVEIPKIQVGEDRYRVEFCIIGNLDEEEVRLFLREICNIPPLSKFGIDSFFSFSETIPFDKRSLFYYSRTNTHQCLMGIKENDKRVAIISPIGINI